MQSEMERFKLSYKLEVSNEACVPLLPCDGALPSCCLHTCGLEAGQPVSSTLPFTPAPMQRFSRCQPASCTSVLGARAHGGPRLLSVMRGHVNIELPFTLENQIQYSTCIKNPKLVLLFDKNGPY